MNAIETPQPQRLLTIAETASILRIGIATAYRLVHSGELPAVRIGGQIRVRREAFHEYLSPEYPRPAA